MKYEQHHLNNRKLPFIFRDDEMVAGEKDFTHWHENIEILYFYEGKGIVSVDFRKSEAEKGDIFVINTEKLHMVESSDSAMPVRYYCLIVDSAFAEENGIPSTKLRFKECIKNDKETAGKFDRVVSAYRSEESFREAAVRAAALELLLDLARRHLAHDGEENVDFYHLDNVKEAIKYIKENYEKPMSLDRISRAAGLSKAYFSRIFKSVTGYTVVSYINLVRCRNAAKLLSGGKYKVGEAAALCGFENLSYFTRTYKQVMGVLPSDERGS